MKIQVHDIPDEGLELSITHSTEGVSPILAELNSRHAVTPLKLDIRLERTGSVLRVTGKMEGCLDLDCSRCLDPVQQPLPDEFDFFLRAPLEEGESEGEEVELAPDQLDYAFYDQNEIDVLALVQEQLLLEVPAQVLCREDCRGICQGCGAELNREACRCEADVVDPRLAVLKELKKRLH